MRQKGYSLIELIIVIAIISILMSITFYGIKFARNGAKRTRAKSDMVSLGQSVVSYHDINKDNSELNDQWPRSMYNQNVIDQISSGAISNRVPWELMEKAYWSKSEPIGSNISYERYPCSPNYGEFFNTDTLVKDPGPAVGFVAKVDYNNTTNRGYACAASADVAYVGINWAGIDNDFGISSGSEAYKDNGFLVIYVQKPIPDGVNVALPDGYGPLPNGKAKGADDYQFTGNFLFKMGGSDEKCASGCSF